MFDLISFSFKVFLLILFHIILQQSLMVVNRSFERFIWLFLIVIFMWMVGVGLFFLVFFITTFLLFSYFIIFFFLRWFFDVEFRLSAPSTLLFSFWFFYISDIFDCIKIILIKGLYVWPLQLLIMLQLFMFASDNWNKLGILLWYNELSLFQRLCDPKD